MQYQTRPGVVLTPICGEYLLVSAKGAREYCPYVTQLNESSAFLWRQLCEGKSAEELKQAVAEEYEIEDPEELGAAIDGFLSQMLEAGYLLEIKDGGQDEK